MRNPFTSLPGAALLTGLIAVGLAVAFAGNNRTHDRAAFVSEAAMLPEATLSGHLGAAASEGAADSASFAGAPDAAPKTEAELAAAARALAERFANTLRPELDRALRASGPVAAIAICRERAPAIAAALAAETGWQIGRTGLKVRNTADLPDVWETRGLQEFAARHAAGEPAASLEVGATVATPAGGRVYRFLKAIPIEEPCLTCHGKTPNPAAAARIAQLYPYDQATGFSLGDVAGAFAIIMPMGE
jgi:hypothetical protein